MVWHIPHADGGHTSTVTEFGIVGKAGVNSHGLAVHFNILHHRADGQGIGFPVHVLARHVLDSTGDLNRALQLIYDPEEHWAAIEAGNLTLYIFRTDDPTPVQRRSAVNLKDRPGFDSFAFEVDNLDAAIRALDGKVEWVIAEPIEWRHPSGTHYRYRPLFDPNGNMLYVTEPHKVGRTSP